jgi:hypothetical protein
MAQALADSLANAGWDLNDPANHKDMIDARKTLRCQDGERGYWPCPESAEQRQFVVA